MSVMILNDEIYIKFPFKRKGLPSCSASLHVKAKKYTCASDFPTLPRVFFVQTLNMIRLEIRPLQANLNLRWDHMPIRWFCHEWQSYFLEF